MEERSDNPETVVSSFASMRVCVCVTEDREGPVCGVIPGHTMPLWWVVGRQTLASGHCELRQSPIFTASSTLR